MLLISNLIKMQNKSQKQERYFKTRSCRFIKRNNIHIFDNDYFVLCQVGAYEVLSCISMYIDTGMFKADEISLALFSYTKKPELITKFAVDNSGYYHHEGNNILFGYEVFRHKNIMQLVKEDSQAWKKFQDNKYINMPTYYLGVCLSNKDNRMNNLGNKVSFVIIGE